MVSDLTPRGPSSGEKGVPPLFLTGPSLHPALNQPLVLMSAKLQPQDTAISRFSMTRRWPVPSGAFSGEVRMGRGREEVDMAIKGNMREPCDGNILNLDYVNVNILVVILY